MFAVVSSSKNRFPWKPGSIQVSVQPNNLREYFSAWQGGVWQDRSKVGVGWGGVGYGRCKG